MNKIEIITHLHSAHAAFWDTAIPLPNGNGSLNGKWSAAQNVAHITMALSRLNNYLVLPKSSIEANFGLSNRASVSNEAFIKTYQHALANGAKATAPFIPEANVDKDMQELVGHGAAVLQEFISHLQNWTEEELELYHCPHPLLGKITVREILYFTIYHVQHHHETINRMK